MGNATPPHRLKNLNTWFPVGGAVGERFRRCSSLAGARAELGNWLWDYTALLGLHFVLCFMLVAEDMSSQLHVLAVLPAATPLAMMNSGTLGQKKPFLLEAALGMVFYSINRNVC